MHLTLAALQVGVQTALEPQLLARGSIAADPDFFGLFGATEQKVATVLSALALDSSTDYHGPIVAATGELAVGFVYAYPLREMFSRQAQSLRRLLSLASDPASMRTPLAELARSKEALKQPDSFYLARIYVMDGTRGRGVGEALLRAFEERARSRGFKDLGLHVRRENVAAQRFYTRQGFQLCNQRSSAAYLGMEKQL